MFRSTSCERCSTPTTWADRVLAPECAPGRRAAWAGLPHVPPHPARLCSPRVAMSCRCSGGSGITPRSFTLDTYVHLLRDGDLGEPLAPLTEGKQHEQTTVQEDRERIREPRVRPRNLRLAGQTPNSPRCPQKADWVYGTEGRELESLRARHRKSCTLGLFVCGGRPRSVAAWRSGQAQGQDPAPPRVWRPVHGRRGSSGRGVDGLHSPFCFRNSRADMRPLLAAGGGRPESARCPRS